MTAPSAAQNANRLNGIRTVPATTGAIEWTTDTNRTGTSIHAPCPARYSSARVHRCSPSSRPTLLARSHGPTSRPSAYPHTCPRNVPAAAEHSTRAYRPGLSAVEPANRTITSPGTSSPSRTVVSSTRSSPVMTARAPGPIEASVSSTPSTRPPSGSIMAGRHRPLSLREGVARAAPLRRSRSCWRASGPRVARLSRHPAARVGEGQPCACPGAGSHCWTRRPIRDFPD